MFRVTYTDGRTKITEGYGFYAAYAIGHDEGAPLVSVKEIAPKVYEIYEDHAATVAELASPKRLRLIATATQL